MTWNDDYEPPAALIEAHAPKTPEERELVRAWLIDCEKMRRARWEAFYGPFPDRPPVARWTLFGNTSFPRALISGAIAAVVTWALICAAGWGLIYLLTGRWP